MAEALARAELAHAAALEAEGEARPEELTDTGNARRLVERSGAYMRWVTESREWLILDESGLWRWDVSDQVVRYAQSSARHLLQFAVAASPDAAKRLSKHGVDSQSRRKLNDAIELAKAEIGISISATMLDADPWALSVANGVIDLRTGKLRDRVPTDFITKSARARYDVEATCPRFDRFVLDAMSGDVAMVDFLRRLVGYSLYGANPEQRLVIPSGIGANGKSTFLSVIGEVLGDYAQITPAETFMARRDGASTNDLARLRGARFVSATEAERGRRLAEALVKRLTGNDRIAARFLFAEFFEFVPQFLAWLAVNHKPIVSGDDPAIWRRLLVVPFDFVVPVEQRDPRLVENLLTERDGILAWAVRGCLEWQRDGLGVPSRCQLAADEYRESMDTIGLWIDERTQTGAGASKASVLYANYKHWCDQNGHAPLSSTRFGMTLGERGFDKQKMNSGFVYRGLSVVSA